MNAPPLRDDAQTLTGAERALLEDLWAGSHSRAVAAARFASHGRADAEDAAATSWEQVARRLRAGANILDLGAYWAQASRAAALTQVRASSRIDVVADTQQVEGRPMVTEAVDPVDQVLGELEGVVVAEALRALDEHERNLIVARYIKEMSVSEIAVSLSVTPNAATERIRRAKQRLRDSYVAQHAGASDDPACRATRMQMRAFGLGRLSAARLRRFEAHIEACSPCRHALPEVLDVVAQTAA